MSITYGNFSGPLSSTVNSGFVSGTAIYFTIPWYNASYIQRVRIYSPTGSSTNFANMYIVANGAHERIGDSTSVDEYYYVDVSGKTVSSATNYSAQWSIDPELYYEDEYARGFLYVKVDFAGAATISGHRFICTVNGRKANPAILRNTEVTGASKDKYTRVLLGKGQSGNGGTGGVITDITNFARMAAFGSTTGISIGATNDYIYFGSTEKVDHWEIGVGIASTNAGALQGQLWNGSAWSSFTVLDNTAGTANSSLRYSGIVEGFGIGSSTWVATKLDPTVNILFPNDPQTAYENQILAGTAPPLGFFNNPQRFWTRFNVPSGLLDVAYLKYFIGIQEFYQ